MQLSLRSQMIAGTTAVVGATAIAMGPVAPAVQLPSLSPTQASVALTALNNPINEILLSANLAVGYLLDSTVVGPGLVWVGSGIDPVGVLNGIPEDFFAPNTPPADVPGVLPFLGVLNEGLIPNLLANPLPALTQLTSNWLGYTQDAVAAGGAIAGALSTLAWLPVSLGVTIFEDIVNGNVGDIAGDIQDAINDAFTEVNIALGAASTVTQAIVNDIFTNGANVINAVTGQLPALLGVVTGSFNALSLTIQNVSGAITEGFTTGGISGGWNAAIKGLLGVDPTGNYGPAGPGEGFTLPGTLINLTIGPGMQIGPITNEATLATNFAPSLRTVVTGFTNTLAEALGAPAPAPSPLASVRSGGARAAAAADSAKPAGHRSGARSGAAKAKAGR